MLILKPYEYDERYYVTAFWKEDDKENGINWLKRWRTFVNEAAAKVVKK